MFNIRYNLFTFGTFQHIIGISKAILDFHNLFKDHQTNIKIKNQWSDNQYLNGGLRWVINEWEQWNCEGNFVRKVSILQIELDERRAQFECGVKLGIAISEFAWLLFRISWCVRSKNCNLSLHVNGWVRLRS